MGSALKSRSAPASEKGVVTFQNSFRCGGDVPPNARFREGMMTGGRRSASFYKTLEVGDGAMPSYRPRTRSTAPAPFPDHHRQIAVQSIYVPGRNLVAECLSTSPHSTRRDRCAGVSGCDRADHVRGAAYACLGTIIGQLLGAVLSAFGEPRPCSECRQIPAVTLSGAHHGIGAGAQRAGGFRRGMEFSAGQSFGDYSPPPSDLHPTGRCRNCRLRPDLP